MSKHSMRLGSLGEHKRIGQCLLNGFAQGLEHAGQALRVRLLGILSGQVDEGALFAALREPASSMRAPYAFAQKRG